MQVAVFQAFILGACRQHPLQFDILVTMRRAMQTRTTDRWIQPHFKTDFGVQLSLESGGDTCRFQLRSVNISMRNMQVECEKEVVDCFKAQQEYPYTCEVLFRLPGEQERESVRIYCQMVTHRRLSQKQFYLTLKFVEFEGDSAGRLEGYLLSRQPSSASGDNGRQTVVNLPRRMRA